LRIVAGDRCAELVRGIRHESALRAQHLVDPGVRIARMSPSAIGGAFSTISRRMQAMLRSKLALRNVRTTYAVA
jgi:hypothetical protein